MPSVTITNTANPAIKFLEDFKESALYIKNNPFRDIRQKAIQHFERLGFPTTRNEEWKYTNILPLVSKTLQPAKREFVLNSFEDLNISIPMNNAIVLILENGYLNRHVSEMNALPAGLTVKNIDECESDVVFAKHFAKYAEQDKDAFSALNTAFFKEGVYVHIAKDALIEKPLYIVSFSTSGEEDVISFPRCMVVAEKGSKASVEWITVSKIRREATVLRNTVIEIAVEENARLDFCILQNDHHHVSQVCNTYAYQASNSHFNINTVTTGGNLVRNKLHIMLDGMNVETHLFGLAMGGGSQLIDNHTAVFHAKPNCFSNQRYKSIMDGSSLGVFNGKIMVMKDAQKTNAYQSNKNILLSDNAAMYAKPQLEIFADDVKCSHGATTGQIDEEALFYLRTRGIGIERAKSLLNVAFAADVVSNIPNEALRTYILDLIENKLTVYNN